MERILKNQTSEKHKTRTNGGSTTAMADCHEPMPTYYEALWNAITDPVTALPRFADHEHMAYFCSRQSGSPRHDALFYLIGMTSATRENEARIYDKANDATISESVEETWCNACERRNLMLAFHLFSVSHGQPFGAVSLHSIFSLFGDSLNVFLYTSLAVRYTLKGDWSGMAYADKSHEEYFGRNGSDEAKAEPLRYLFGIHKETRESGCLMFPTGSYRLNTDELWRVRSLHQHTASALCLAFHLFTGKGTVRLHEIFSDGRLDALMLIAIILHFRW